MRECGRRATMAQSWRTPPNFMDASGMKVLFCVPFKLAEPKGNSVAATRLMAGLVLKGIAVEVAAPPQVEEPRVMTEWAKKFDPDVALVFHAWRCRTAFKAIMEAGPFPQVVSLRGTDLNEMLDDPACRGEIRAILNACSGITVFHEAAATRLSTIDRTFTEKTFVIPNGVFLPSSDEDFRSRLGVPKESFVFGAVAGLREVKRPLMILPWLARLREEFPRLAWIHAGEPLETAVTHRLRELSLKFRWMYHVDLVGHSEIDSFLRAADVFVAASRSEGSPHAVREAMLAGMPVLLSDIPGHRNMATASHEALFFNGEVEFMHQARKLIQDPDLCRQLGEAARKRVENELEQKDEIASYIGMFTTIIQKGKGKTHE